LSEVVLHSAGGEKGRPRGRRPRVWGPGTATLPCPVSLFLPPHCIVHQNSCMVCDLSCLPGDSPVHCLFMSCHVGGWYVVVAGGCERAFLQECSTSEFFSAARRQDASRARATLYDQIHPPVYILPAHTKAPPRPAFQLRCPRARGKRLEGGGEYTSPKGMWRVRVKACAYGRNCHILMPPHSLPALFCLFLHVSWEMMRLSTACFSQAAVIWCRQAWLQDASSSCLPFTLI